jgi:hypothetical protein
VQNEEIQDYNEPLKRELEQFEKDLTVPTPDNPRWNSWIALAFWFFSVLLIVLLPMFFFLPYAIQQKVNPSDSRALTNLLTNDQTAIVLNILPVIPAHLLTLLVGWIIVTRFNKQPFFEGLGNNWGGFKFWHGLLMLVGFFALAAVVGNYFPEQENDLIRVLKSSRTATILIALIATFSAPIVEEVVYRGVLYSAFQKALGRFTAIILVTFLFALVHVPQYLPSYSTIALITLLSLMLTLVRAWTKNLLPCIALHFVFNGIQSLLLVLEPYLPKTAPDVAPTTGFIFFFIK